MRAFVAVDVPRDDAGPSAEAASHVTLRFFHDLAPDLLPVVVAALDHVAADTTPFRLELAGVGAFPDARSPRVVWVGATAGRPELVDVATRLDAELDVHGIPREPRPFVPHATLFRVRGPRDRERAARALAEPGDRHYGATTVHELLLKESTLRRSGALHAIVHRSPFRGAVRDG